MECEVGGAWGGAESDEIKGGSFQPAFETLGASEGRLVDWPRPLSSSDETGLSSGIVCNSSSDFDGVAPPTSLEDEEREGVVTVDPAGAAGANVNGLPPEK